MKTEHERVALRLAWEYAGLPVNWGTDGLEVRAASQDGFTEGFEAGMKYALGIVKAAADAVLEDV